MSGQRLHVSRQYVIMKSVSSHELAQLAASSVQVAIESVNTGLLENKYDVLQQCVTL